MDLSGVSNLGRTYGRAIEFARRKLPFLGRRPDPAQVNQSAAAAFRPRGAAMVRTAKPSWRSLIGDRTVYRCTHFGAAAHRHWLVDPVRLHQEWRPLI